MKNYIIFIFSFISIINITLSQNKIILTKLDSLRAIREYERLSPLGELNLLCFQYIFLDENAEEKINENEIRDFFFSKIQVNFVNINVKRLFEIPQEIFYGKDNRYKVGEFTIAISMVGNKNPVAFHIDIRLYHKNYYENGDEKLATNRESLGYCHERNLMKNIKKIINELIVETANEYAEAKKFINQFNTNFRKNIK